jgi:hypothetical protein
MVHVKDYPEVRVSTETHSLRRPYYFKDVAYGSRGRVHDFGQMGSATRRMTDGAGTDDFFLYSTTIPPPLWYCN